MKALLLYIGPGAGLEVMGALWALIATMGAAFGVILFAPIRALIRRMRQKGKDGAIRDTQAADGDEKDDQPRDQ